MSLLGSGSVHVEGRHARVRPRTKRCDCGIYLLAASVGAVIGRVLPNKVLLPCWCIHRLFAGSPPPFLPLRPRSTPASHGRSAAHRRREDRRRRLRPLSASDACKPATGRTSARTRRHTSLARPGRSSCSTPGCADAVAALARKPRTTAAPSGCEMCAQVRWDAVSAATDVLPICWRHCCVHLVWARVLKETDGAEPGSTPLLRRGHRSRCDVNVLSTAPDPPGQPLTQPALRSVTFFRSYVNPQIDLAESAQRGPWLQTRRYLDPSDLLPEDREKDATQNGPDSVTKPDAKKKKQKRKAEAVSSSDSDSSSGSDSDSSSSSDSDSSSSSSDDSSDSSSNDSDSSSSSSSSDSDSSDSSDSDSGDSSSSSDSDSSDSDSSDSSGSDSADVKKLFNKGGCWQTGQTSRFCCITVHSVDKPLCIQLVGERGCETDSSAYCNARSIGAGAWPEARGWGVEGEGAVGHRSRIAGSPR